MAIQKRQRTSSAPRSPSIPHDVEWSAVRARWAATTPLLYTFWGDLTPSNVDHYTNDLLKHAPLMDRRDMILNLNTAGGHADAAARIAATFDFIRNTGGDVWVYNARSVMSAGLIVYLAADPGRRLCAPDALFGIHSASMPQLLTGEVKNHILSTPIGRGIARLPGIGSTLLTSLTIRETRYVNRQRALCIRDEANPAYAQLLASRTRLEPARIASMLQRERITTLTAYEAVRDGIADTKDIPADITTALDSQNHLPKQVPPIATATNTIHGGNIHHFLR